MKQEVVTFQSNGHNLVGTLTLPDGRLKGALLRISGGANIGYSPNKWQARIAESGIASFGFDFVGVDQSEGKLSETNLLTRLEDSSQALRKFQELIGGDLPITLFGVSMGAPIAIWLTGQHEVAGLILTVAAAYPSNSHDKNFGPAFSEAIRGDGKWRDSVEFEKLDALTVPLLFVSALKDEVIPQDITKKYEDVVGRRGGKSIHFDVPHRFLRESGDEYADDIKAFWKVVSEFIRDNKHT